MSRTRSNNKSASPSSALSILASMALLIPFAVAYSTASDNSVRPTEHSPTNEHSPTKAGDVRSSVESLEQDTSDIFEQSIEADTIHKGDLMVENAVFVNASSILLTPTGMSQVGLSRLPAFTSKKGETVYIKPGQKLGVNWGVSRAGNNFVVQRLNGNRWTNVQQVSSRGSGQRWTLSYSVPSMSAGSQAVYRVYRPASDGFAEWSSAEQTVVYTFAASGFSRSSNSLVNHSWPTGLKQKYTVTGIKGAQSRKVELQQRDSKKNKWTIVSRSTSSSSTVGTAVITIPAVSKSQKIEYRLRAPKTSKYDEVYSSKFSVTYLSPTDSSSSFIRSTYKTIKRYCPHVLIEEKKTPTRNTPDGRAYFSQMRIVLASRGYPAKRQKYVALHECAHIIQGVSYSQNISSMKRASNGVFGTKGDKGFENLADCMSFEMGAVKSYAPYTKSCSSHARQAAKDVLRGKMIGQR